MDAVIKVILRFLGAVTFLTRIPVPSFCFNLEHKLKNNDNEITLKPETLTCYFPVIGIIMGIGYYLAAHVFSVFFPDTITAFVFVIFTVYVTGGLHLDGLSDAFDGLYSGRSGSELINIMRDSNIGVYGGFALWMLLLGKWLAVFNIIENGEMLVLLLFPWIARLILYQIIKTYPYPKNLTGLGEKFKANYDSKPNINSVTKIIAVMAGPVISLLALFTVIWGIISISTVNSLNPDQILIYLAAAIIAGIIANIFAYRFHLKLQGITGDVYGASVELSEFIFLIAVIGGWGL